MERQASPSLVSELHCRCRNNSQCPRVQRFSDGSLVITDEEQGATPVRFDPEQAAMLARELARPASLPDYENT